MHGCFFCSEMEKNELRIMDGPTNHGSTRIVNEPGNSPGEDSGAIGGLNMSRKEVSPLSDLTVKDMATRAQYTLWCRTVAGGKHEGRESRLRGVKNASRHVAERKENIVLKWGETPTTAIMEYT